MKRLLIIGCGDVATRALPQLAKTFEISVLVRSPAAPFPTVGNRAAWSGHQLAYFFARRLASSTKRFCSTMLLWTSNARATLAVS